LVLPEILFEPPHTHWYFFLPFFLVLLSGLAALNAICFPSSTSEILDIRLLLRKCQASPPSEKFTQKSVEAAGFPPPLFSRLPSFPSFFFATHGRRNRSSLPLPINANTPVWRPFRRVARFLSSRN